MDEDFMREIKEGYNKLPEDKKLLVMPFLWGYYCARGGDAETIFYHALNKAVENQRKE